MLIAKLICQCNLCLHEWLPRNGEMPERCAGCKSHNWNVIPKGMKN